MKKTLYAVLVALFMVSCTPNKVKNENATKESPTPENQVEVAAEGHMAPDFTLNDLEGKPLTLSSLRGRYVVLDFWGTWCRYCVQGIPDMRAYYHKYEGMFEMLSIDFGDDEDTWLRAIDSYDMDWLHVITDEDSAAELQEKYALEGFPTKIIVDPHGNIVHITVGEDPAFYKYLDELFGTK